MIVTFIIPAGNLVAVKAKLQQGADDPTKNLRGILGMFTTGLSPSGSGTPTHYVSTGQGSEEEIAWLEANLPQSLDVYKSPVTPWEAFAEKGLKIINPGV